MKVFTLYLKLPALPRFHRFFCSWGEYAQHIAFAYIREIVRGEKERELEPTISPLATQWTLVMIRNGSQEREEITHTFGAAAALSSNKTNKRRLKSDLRNFNLAMHL